MSDLARARELLHQVRLNQARLEACRGHAFEPVPDPRLTDGIIFLRYRCAKCLGEVDSHGHYWFTEGVRHAGLAA